MSFFDDETDKKAKNKLIEELRSIILRWLKLFRSGEEEFSGELAIFGSFRLGANIKYGDIDLVILAPS